MLPFHFARFGFTHVLGKEHWFMFLWTSCMPGFELKEISFARNTFFAINSTHIMETLRKFYAHISRSCRLLILQCATWNDNCFPVRGINFNSDALRVPHPGCALQKIWKDEPQTNKTSECQNIVISQRLFELHQEHGRPGGPSQVWEDIVQAQGGPQVCQQNCGRWWPLQWCSSFFGTFQEVFADFTPDHCFTRHIWEISGHIRCRRHFAGRMSLMLKSLSP